MDKPSLRMRVTVEAVGTFGFFFIGFMGIAAAITYPGSIGTVGVAVGFGGGLALMIFAFGHISGGHYNPAVSLGLAVEGEFPWAELPAYWAGQLVGGLAAAGLVRLLFTDQVGKALVNAPASATSSGTAFVLEAVTTAIFVMVISTVATDKRAPWNGVLAPLAIGGFVFVGANVIGPFTGASFNIARSLAPAIVAGSFGHIWIYLAGPAIGAVLGGAAARGISGRETAPRLS
jgi:MIP family channel proteins